jgi:hypothetical protein
MCFGESQLKFLVIFLLVIFSLPLFADCSDGEKKIISKLLKANGLEALSIGDIWDNDGVCTFETSTALATGKRFNRYIYRGEDRFTKMLRHGVETYYSLYEVNSKIKKYERHYVYGKIEGLETTFYPNGKIESEVRYKNDLPHGIKTTWNEDGIKISEKLYRDGVLSKVNEPVVAGKASAENNQIEIAKQKCLKLGFKEKTEKFGICVLEFIN